MSTKQKNWAGVSVWVGAMMVCVGCYAVWPPLAAIVFGLWLMVVGVGLGSMCK